ncbi:MAG TPA: hypothetical protein VG889_17055 [Rhizomicrobium sp.]|nr:hypothetical protein [Rhizomicrobium sp.]
MAFVGAGFMLAAAAVAVATFMLHSPFLGSMVTVPGMVAGFLVAAALLAIGIWAVRDGARGGWN